MRRAALPGHAKTCQAFHVIPRKTHLVVRPVPVLVAVAAAPRPHATGRLFFPRHKTLGSEIHPWDVHGLPVTLSLPPHTTTSAGASASESATAGSGGRAVGTRTSVGNGGLPLHEVV